MALEDLTGSDKFIDNLDEANPVGATDFLSTADDHIRGVKNVLKNTLPNVNAALTMTPTEANSWEARLLVVEAFIAADKPVGTILESTSAVNPTTYLTGTWTQIGKGRTLIGAGAGAGLTSRTAGATGGVEDAVVVAHQHDSAGGHNHTVSAQNWALGGYTDDGGAPDEKSQTNNITSSTDGAHQHPSEGVSGVDKNMMPYLVVYIWERTA